MISKPAPVFSIIVPTRERPDGLRRLLDSFAVTTTRPHAVEVVLVVDADDNQSKEFAYDRIPLKRVVVQPGLNMGALNLAGYEASTGDYIMLLNDDVIVRTRGWDEKVGAAFKTFNDGIVLVHVNDKIFEEKLCTFPFLSRNYCDIAGGICPRDYVRYRIDDHIYNVFNLLSVLGKNRILYLPEVVFEHTNHVRTALGEIEYVPNEKIHGIDTEKFHALLADRKQLAHRLMDHIDGERERAKRPVRQNLLSPIVDSVALRRPEYIRVWSETASLSTDATRVTIGIVSADLRADHARTCVDLVKKLTKNCDLILLDNNRRPTFNHPHEMNKLISACETDFLVLMDDDVFVEPGWLDGMLRCMTSSVGVVTPLHKDLSGNLSYAGVVMRPDYSGHHTHSFALPEQSTRIQTLCSAILLIDVSKCGHVRFDECYSKYFLDIDYGFRIWEAGFQVVCSPYTMVTHIGGGTLKHGSNMSNDLVEKDRTHYVCEWIETKRYNRLEQGIWQSMPEIKALLDIPGDLSELLENFPGENAVAAKNALLAFFRSLKNSPAIRDWAYAKLQELVYGRLGAGSADLGHLGFLLGCGATAVPIEQNFEGFNIFLYDAVYYAIPQMEGGFDYPRFVSGSYSQSYHGESLELIKVRIQGGIAERVPETRMAIGNSNGNPVLVEQRDDGLNVICAYGNYYAIPQGEGDFDYEAFAKGCYSRSYSAKNLDELKAQINSGLTSRIWLVAKNERLRTGSWRLASRSLLKRILKKFVISNFGFDAFLEMKGRYLQIRTEEYERRARCPALMSGAKLVFQYGARHVWSKLSPGQPGVKGLVAAAGENRLAKAESADPERWLNGSPVTLVEPEYRGYAVFRFEYKYFAVAGTADAFNYQDFKCGRYGLCPIGHSLSEVHAKVDQFLASKETGRRARVLVLASLPVHQLKPLLERFYPCESLALLTENGARGAWKGYDLIVADNSLVDWARRQNSGASDPLSRRLVNEKFDRIVVPWSFPGSFGDNSLETAASRISDCVEIIHSSGERRLYRGENLHRLIYNKAYLASMFQSVPSPLGQTVLEAGCSDGLVCDIFALCGARKIVGIDVMETVGCGFPDDRIEYRVMNMAQMGFADQTFDLVCSIATFEHLANPYQALLEMLRVTKIGGYGYVQAGPLYHSPFGHHMFEYFKNDPWIHLRKTKDQIISYAKEQGIDERIERDLFTTCEQYIDGMLNVDHVNGLFLDEYRLDEFRKRDDVEVVKFNVSYEGRELLTPEVAAEIRGMDAAKLVEHGFEIAFRRNR